MMEREHALVLGGIIVGVALLIWSRGIRGVIWVIAIAVVLVVMEAIKWWLGSTASWIGFGLMILGLHYIVRRCGGLSRFTGSAQNKDAQQGADPNRDGAPSE